MRKIMRFPGSAPVVFNEVFERPDLATGTAVELSAEQARPRYVAAVKVEAQKRIYARFPQWKQANMTARGVELATVRAERMWTPEEQAEAAALTAAWAWVRAVRDASGAIEAADPPLRNYTADEHWPA